MKLAKRKEGPGMLSVVFMLLSAALGGSATAEANDLNGTTSVDTLVRILTSPVAITVIAAKGATLKNPERAFAFKGLRQSTGAVGRCMGCVPHYELIFELPLSDTANACTLFARRRLRYSESRLR